MRIEGSDREQKLTIPDTEQTIGAQLLAQPVCVRDKEESDRDRRRSEKESAQTGEGAHTLRSISIQAVSGACAFAQEVQPHPEKKENSGENYTYGSEDRLRPARQGAVRLHGPFVPGQKLRMRNSTRSIMRRIVKRELVLQAPGKHGNC
jgi:hypothetical protein